MEDELVVEEGWELLDWVTAEERPMVAGGFQLVVEGVSPVPMEVEFHSLPIPIAPEEYHGVQVRGRRKEPVIEVETPWRLERDASTMPRGTVGYVLIGKTKRAYFPPKKDE